MTGLRRGIIGVSIGSVAMFAGCRRDRETPAVDTTAVGRHQAGSLEGVTTDSSAGTAPLQRISPSATFAATLSALEADMRAMTGARGDQLRAMVPRHRQLVTTMIAQMDSNMRAANSGTSAGWVVTRDSVNRDLIRLRDMSAHEIQAMMPGHETRVGRLMEMQRGAMGGMRRMMANP